MEDQVPRETAMERLRHLSRIQDEVTEERNSAWVGRRDRVLVDQVEDGVPLGRGHRQAPDIDGVVRLDRGHVGDWLEVEYVAAYGPDLEAVQVPSTKYVVPA
jgi:ribosomal protein S12 methylthiotransferase